MFLTVPWPIALPPPQGISMGTVPLLSDPHKMWHSRKGNETEGKGMEGQVCMGEGGNDRKAAIEPTLRP